MNQPQAPETPKPQQPHAPTRLSGEVPVYGVYVCALAPGVLSVSLPPVLTCAPDVLCADICYARSFYADPRVKAEWDWNYNLAKNAPQEYFSSIKKAIEFHACLKFQFHTGGDFPSQNYLDGVFDLAGELAQVKFLAFTKRYGFDFSKRPDNFRLFVSTWPGMPVPQTALPLSWYRNDPKAPSTNKKCVGVCGVCTDCWETSEP